VLFEILLLTGVVHTQQQYSIAGCTGRLQALGEGGMRTGKL